MVLPRDLDDVIATVAMARRYAAPVLPRGGFKVERLYVRSRSGPLEATDRIEYAGLSLERVDLAISVQEFTAMHTPAIQTVISGGLAVRGSLQEMLATGGVTVPRGRVLLDELLWGGPAKVESWELTVAGVYGPGPEAVSSTDGGCMLAQFGSGLSLPFLRANLIIEVPQNFWVQAPGTAVELSGEIRVRKELNEAFTLNGTIDSVRGYARYYGRRFEIEEVQVIFTGSEEVNPHLNVSVTHAVPGYVVSIHLEGRLQEP